jgi:perosamine synthetase
MIKIPYYRPYFNTKEIKAASCVIRSGYLAQGKEVEKLEDEYSEHCGGDYCIAVSSATAGLYLVLKYKKIYEGLKSIDIPAYTFCATYQAAKATGLIVNILDVDDNYNIDSYNCLHVLIAGTRTVCSPRLIDAAHSFPHHSYSDTVYSFYPTKPIASNGGGMIVTKNKKLADWCRKIRQHGRKQAVGHAENPLNGFNFWMSDLNAAIAREQLKKIQFLKESRKGIVNRYLQELKGIDCYYGDHLFIIREKGREIEKEFIDNKIGYSRPYIPLSKTAKNAWRLYNDSISIPYYVGLSKNNQQKICDIVKGICK